MVDKDLVLRVRGIAGVHDKPRQVPEAVNPERVAVEVSRRSLELDTRSSFILLTVENHLPNRLEVNIVVNQSSKQLVHHASLHAVSIASLCTFLETVDAALDQIGMTLPLKLSSFAVKELDQKGAMLKSLLAFRSDGVDQD